jgi:hypothetical protein
MEIELLNVFCSESINLLPNQNHKAQIQYRLAFGLYGCRECVTEFEPISERLGSHSRIFKAFSELLKRFDSCWGYTPRGRND